MFKKTKFGICAGSVALASVCYGSISINIAAGTLRDENGLAINSGLVILAVDTARDGFALPSTTAFLQGDDMEVARWNFSEGGGFDGEFLGSKLIGTYDTVNWTAGDPLALFWYPALDKDSTQPIDGSSNPAKFGVFANPKGETAGEPWTLPADDTHLYQLEFYAEGSLLSQNTFASEFVAGASLESGGSISDLADVMTDPMKTDATSNTISWDKDLAASAQAFTIQRRVVGDTAWETLGAVGASTDSFVDDTLIPGRTYEYQVIAENGLSALASFADGVELFSERSILASVAARSMMENAVPRRMYGQVDVAGTAPVKNVIIQASGPWLSGKIIGDPVLDPSIELYNHPNANFGDRVTVRDDIDDWMSETNALAIDQVQADFGPDIDTRRVNVLADSSKDASWLGTVTSGVANTFAVNTEDGSEGPVHIGIYNAEKEGTQFTPNDNRIVALATRGYLGTRIGHKMFGEFTIEGNVKKTVLIRGLGPNLVNFPPLGDGNALRAVVEDPSITLYYHPDPINDIGNRTEIAFNDDWQSQVSSSVVISDLEKIALAEQAMLDFDPRQVAFANGSKDALLLVDLDPGVYTFLLNAPGTGIGLLGIYEIEIPL